MATKRLDKDASIAVYLRKSREDANQEDTLSKHRQQLKEYVSSNGFNNVTWYEEIGSGDSIEGRPVFKSLLPMIEQGKFDAVLVVAQDRLSRGSQIEAGIIQEAFEESGTILLTPSRSYNWEDEGDIMLSEFESVISRNEYRAIKRRLKQGKINAAKEGRLHSGNPPFPYYWDKNTKTAEVDEEQAKIYRLMVEWYVKDGLSGVEVAEKLNEMQIPTPRKRGNWGKWRSEVVTRILLNDFHLGFVCYGRYKLNKNGNVERNPDPDSAIVVRGNHTPLKTEEEHAAIMKHIASLRTHNRQDRKTRKDSFRLSGLVRCPYCGKCQSVYKQKGKKEHLAKCYKKSQTRTAACDTTKGIYEEEVFQAVLRYMREYKEELFSPSEINEQQTESSLQSLIEIQEKIVEKSERRIEKVKEMFKNDLIEIQELKNDISTEEAAIKKAENQISELKKSSSYLDKAEEEKRRQQWSSADVERLLSGDEMQPSEINAILRRLIESISFTIEQTEAGTLDLNVTVTPK